MSDRFLHGLAGAIRAELSVRPGLPLSGVLVLLIARGQAFSTVSCEEISDRLGVGPAAVPRLVRPLSEWGEPRGGGGLLRLRTGADRSDRYVELTAAGQDLCERLGRADPDRADPSAGRVLHALFEFRAALGVGRLRDIALLIDLREAEDLPDDGRPFPNGSGQMRRLKDAGLLGRPGAPSRSSLRPPPLSAEGRNLLRRLTGPEPELLGWADPADGASFPGDPF